MAKEVTVDAKLTVVLILFVVLPEPLSVALSEGDEIVGGNGGLPLRSPRALDEAELKVPNRGMIKPSYQIRFWMQILRMTVLLLF